MVVLTEQSDMIPIFRADNSHGLLVEAQFASVCLKGAGDGPVSGV